MKARGSVGKLAGSKLRFAQVELCDLPRTNIQGSPRLSLAALKIPGERTEERHIDALQGALWRDLFGLAGSFKGFGEITQICVAPRQVRVRGPVGGVLPN